jgi:hypothetical protein
LSTGKPVGQHRALRIYREGAKEGTERRKARPFPRDFTAKDAKDAKKPKKAKNGAWEKTEKKKRGKKNRKKKKAKANRGFIAQPFAPLASFAVNLPVFRSFLPAFAVNP